MTNRPKLSYQQQVKSILAPNSSKVVGDPQSFYNGHKRAISEAAKVAGAADAEISGLMADNAELLRAIKASFKINQKGKR